MYPTVNIVVSPGSIQGMIKAIRHQIQFNHINN